MKSLNVNGIDYVFKPLSLGTLERMGDRIANFDNLNVLEQCTLTIDLVFESLRRTYPNIERELVADMIDVENMYQIVPVMMKISGLSTEVNTAGEEAKK